MRINADGVESENIREASLSLDTLVKLETICYEPVKRVKEAGGCVYISLLPNSRSQHERTSIFQDGSHVEGAQKASEGNTNSVFDITKHLERRPVPSVSVGGCVLQETECMMA